MPPQFGLEAVDDEEGIQKLSEWASMQPHLPTVPRKLISQMLHSCYGSVERSKTAIDSFFTIRTHAPDLFRDISVFDERFEAAMTVMYACHLIGVNKEGYNGALFKFQDTDIRKFDFTGVLRAVIAAFFAVLDEDHRAPGYHAIFDFTGVSMAHIMRVSLTSLKQVITFVQEALPIRLKGIHFINSTPIVQNVVNLVKPLLKNELTEIFYVHTVEEMPSFYSKFVDQVAMPLEYGGANRSTHSLHDSTLKTIQDHAEYLRELDGLFVDESKRIGKSKSSSEVFGIQGSFKKLDLD